MVSGKGRIPERADPGWRYPVEITDEFRRWCDAMGYRYESEAAAAIFVWSRLPADMRDRAKRAMAGHGKFELP